MGTTQTPSPPLWSARSSRCRVLIECLDEARRAGLVTALEATGHEVLACAGPEPERDRPCPAVEGGRCGPAAHADVVVVDFDDHDHQSRRLPVAVASELREGATVIVLLDPLEARRHGDELEGCRLLLRPVTHRQVLAAVASAIDDLATRRSHPGRPARRVL